MHHRHNSPCNLGKPARQMLETLPCQTERWIGDDAVGMILRVCGIAACIINDYSLPIHDSLVLPYLMVRGLEEWGWWGF